MLPSVVGIHEIGTSVIVVLLWGYNFAHLSPRGMRKRADLPKTKQLLDNGQRTCTRGTTEYKFDARETVNHVESGPVGCESHAQQNRLQTRYTAMYEFVAGGVSRLFSFLSLMYHYFVLFRFFFSVRSHSVSCKA